MGLVALKNVPIFSVGFLHHRFLPYYLLLVKKYLLLSNLSSCQNSLFHLPSYQNRLVEELECMNIEQMIFGSKGFCFKNEFCDRSSMKLLNFQ